MSTLAEFELSIRRAPRRAQVLIMLASLSESFPGALAHACGIERRRLRWIMHGKPPYYRTELGLITLGLVEAIKTGNSTMYRITEKGRRKARQLTARGVRRQIARVATARRNFEEMPTAAVVPSAMPPLLLDASASSFTWSVMCPGI